MKMLKVTKTAMLKEMKMEMVVMVEVLNVIVIVGLFGIQVCYGV
jgi:hypothetical protein